MDAKNKDEKTPFSEAVASDQVEMVAEMLKIVNEEERDSLLNKTHNKENEYPLHVAAKRGHIKMFNLLLDNGADILKGKTNNGSTPLDVAINEEQRDIIRAIINAKGLLKLIFLQEVAPDDNEHICSFYHPPHMVMRFLCCSFRIISIIFIF